MIPENPFIERGANNSIEDVLANPDNNRQRGKWSTTTNADNGSNQPNNEPANDPFNDFDGSGFSAFGGSIGLVLAVVLAAYLAVKAVMA